MSLQKNFRSERGQAIVVIALAIVGLIAMTGLAVDGGLAYSDRRQAQNAADAAALAAALARVRGDDYASAALISAQSNGYGNDGERSQVEIHLPPISGQYAGNQQYIQIVIVSRKPTVFGPVVGVRTLTNRVEAVTRAKPAEWTEMLNGFAVVSLAPHSDCQSAKAFWVHGEGTLDLQGGGIWVNSDNSKCAFIQQGNGSVAIEDNSQLYIVGGASVQKPHLLKRQSPGLGYMIRKDGNIPLQPIVGVIPIPYPPPFVMPKISCGTNVATVSDDGTTISPGFWDPSEEEPTFPPKDVTTLKSGVYCIGGDVRVNKGTLEGKQVILVVDGAVHFSGSAAIKLEAPGGGPFKGLLIYLPLGNKNIITLNGNNESVFRGTILAPSSRIRINGNDSSFGYHSQIIGLYIELTGSSNVVVKYHDDQNYDAIISPSVEISQ